MVGKKASSRFRPSTVTATLTDGSVTCECGSPMTPWNYTSFPDRRKHILWRCDRDPDHITVMLPLPGN